MNAGALSATITRQGYLSVNGNSVLYPAVAVNGSGAAAIGLTLVGQDYYPSAAYVRLPAAGAPNTLNVLAAGAAPEDGSPAMSRRRAAGQPGGAITLPPPWMRAATCGSPPSTFPPCPGPSWPTGARSSARSRRSLLISRVARSSFRRPGGGFCCSYSFASAMTGSIRVTRRAGRNEATRLAVASVIRTAANTIVSRGFT